MRQLLRLVLVGFALAACAPKSPEPTCSDGVQGGNETDVDCGGSCGPCEAGAKCLANADCESLACGAGHVCAECATAESCPGAVTECQTRTCVSGVCGISYRPSGTRLASQTAGDCHSMQCDGAGNTISAVDDTDPPDFGNPCTDEACVDGVPSSTNSPAGVSCASDGSAHPLCDGNGSCVECLAPSDCPGQDSACAARTCEAGTCGFAFAPAGTVVASQTPGDCTQNQCDGLGSVTPVEDPSDILPDDNECTDDVCNGFTPTHPPKPAGMPVSTQTAGDCIQNQCDGTGSIMAAADPTDAPLDDNDCTDDLCNGSTPMHSARPYGMACGQSGNAYCDGTGQCLAVELVVMRVGDGAAALSSAATPVFLEQRIGDGTLVGAEIALPIAPSGPNAACTLSGTATSEGSLSLSEDGRFVALACYDAPPGTASIATTPAGTVHRIAASVSIAGAIDTSTRMSGAFGAGSVRGATTSDGTAFWVSGAGTPGGVHHVLLGSPGDSTQVLATPSSTRVVHLFGGQLYGSAAPSALTSVFTIGIGEPITSGQSATSLPGLPTSGASPHSFAVFNTLGGGPDLIYVADDRPIASGGGIQKWLFDGNAWMLVATFDGGLGSGIRGLAAARTDASYTLYATTAEPSANRVVKLVDDGTAQPTALILSTAPVNTVYRGVALAPR